MRRRVFAGITALALVVPLTARAECPPAMLPDVALRPAKPTAPTKPPCLDAKGGCPGWEAYSYNDAIKAYNGQIAAYRPLAEAYVKALNSYVKASSDYAQCEVKALQ